MNILDLNFSLISIDKVKRKPIRISIGNEYYTISKHNEDFYLYSDRCRHRGARLEFANPCKDNHLVCPYHGKKNEPLKKLFVKYNFLWIEEPIFFSEVPSHFHFCGSKEVQLSAPFHVVVDNFNEGSHTPFVHRFLGPHFSDLSQTEFSWQSEPDYVHIKYKTNQKKNFLFYGFNKRRNIDWIIDWKTYVNPLYMRYYSEWILREKQKNILEKNMTFFFIVPKGKDSSSIVSFVFVEPLSWLKYFPWLLKKISMLLTTNQIMEDERFYPKIYDLPLSFDGMDLDKYDEPLIEIRKRASAFYTDFLK
ncbi:MAG: Rieske 2Fe-2S domain-containing protein [Bdellovibrionales bacterium]|nr:Rieske 2Fe-2S domain-containing protein [Bdellovibrionales bacterium]